MEQTVLGALFNNASLLLVLTVIYEVTFAVPSRYGRIRQVFNGLLIASICIAIMSMPFTLQPGVVYDTRSILICVTALIFGTIPTVITAAAAIIFRIYMGGAGTMPGLAVIITSAMIGLSWRRWFYPKSRWRWLSVYAMSVGVHLTMLACMLLLPYPNSISVIRQIALPVMVIYPVASVLLSLLLIRQQDIKDAQAQLQISEAKYRRIAENISDVVWATDLNLKTNYLSPSIERLVGERAEAHLQRTLEEKLPPESIRKIRTLLEEEMRKESEPVCDKDRTFFIELEQYRADGSRIWVSMNISIIRDENGKPTGFQGVSRDITKLKKAEEELRASEEKHRRLFETMAEGVVYQSADGSIISANPAAERILGLTFDQMHWRTSMDPEWKAIREDGSEVLGLEHPAMISLRTGQPYGPFIMGVYKPQVNDYVWLSINAIPLFRSGESKPFQAYTTFQEITAERKANLRYQLLFKEMIDAFALHEIICDTDGKPVDYRFLAVNPAFEHMTGFKSEAILGRTVMEVMPDTEPYWIEKYGKVALSGEPIKFINYSIVLGRHYEVSAYQPAPNQFAVTFSDITEQIRDREKAMENLSRLRSLLDNSPSPIVIIDENARFVEISTVAEKIFGLPNESVSSNDTSSMAPSDVLKKALRVLSESKGGGQFLENIDEYELDGKKRYFESRIFPINVPQHSIGLFGYIGIDVTDRITAERALKENEEKYISYIESAPDGIFVFDSEGRYIEVNSSASSITGYSREQLVNMSIKDITAEESGEEALRNFEQLKSIGYMKAELKFIHKDGSIRWWTVNAVKLSDDSYLGFSNDITEKKNAEANLVYIANHDMLTGLYNRRFYESELKRIDIPSKLPLSIIIGDINGLKLINDSFGLSEGDKIIMESAKLLSSCCREGDVLCRTGGDEFCILLPKTDAIAAKEILAAIQAACEQYNRKAPDEVHYVNLSLGTDTKHESETDFAQVSKKAEDCMNQRKLLEKNSSYSAILSSMKATMLEKSLETEKHAERIGRLSKKVGKLLNLSQIELDQIELLATLHDIGKVGIAERILKKPGQLDDEEWVEMKKHPEIGYRIAMSSPNLASIADYILATMSVGTEADILKTLREPQFP